MSLTPGHARQPASSVDSLSSVGHQSYQHSIKFEQEITKRITKTKTLKLDFFPGFLLKQKFTLNDVFQTDLTNDLQ